MCSHYYVDSKVIINRIILGRGKYKQDTNNSHV